MELRCELCGEWFYHSDPFEPPEVSLCKECKESDADSYGLADYELDGDD